MTLDELQRANEASHWVAVRRILYRARQMGPGRHSYRAIARAARSNWRTVRAALKYSLKAACHHVSRLLNSQVRQSFLGSNSINKGSAFMDDYLSYRERHGFLFRAIFIFKTRKKRRSRPKLSTQGTKMSPDDMRSFFNRRQDPQSWSETRAKLENKAPALPQNQENVLNNVRTNANRDAVSDNFAKKEPDFGSKNVQDDPAVPAPEWFRKEMRDLMKRLSFQESQQPRRLPERLNTKPDHYSPPDEEWFRRNGHLIPRGK